MPKAREALPLDQAQDVRQLERLAGLLLEAPHLQPHLTIEQPVPRHAGRQAQQQVEVEIRTQRRAHLGAIAAQPFVCINGPAFRCCQQVQRRDEQATWRKFAASVHPHEPVELTGFDERVELHAQAFLAQARQLYTAVHRHRGQLSRRQHDDLDLGI